MYNIYIYWEFSVLKIAISEEDAVYAEVKSFLSIYAQAHAHTFTYRYNEGVN